MFFSKGKVCDTTSKLGKLYVLRFELDDGIVLHKVGMCHTDRTEDRMMEILRSFFMVYRYIPRVTLRKNLTTIVPLLVEQHMHSLLEEWSYSFDKKFDGYKEFFMGLDEQVLLTYLGDFPYNELLQVDSMKIDDYETIGEHLRVLGDPQDNLQF